MRPYSSSRTRSLVGALAVLALLCWTADTSAQVLRFGPFPVDGAQEVPPTGSPGTGTGTCTLDLGTRELKWNVSWSGLLGTETTAHFHGPAPAGVNAPPQVTTGFTSPESGSAILTQQQVSDAVSGLYYFKIHTTAFPGGEIRGQMTLSPTGVPAMSTFGMVTLAVAVVAIAAFVLRRRTRLATG